MAGRVLFRADASPQIGFGHVMRCLTLADALSERGARCEFVSRSLPEPLVDAISSRHILRRLRGGAAGGTEVVRQEEDARETLELVGAQRFDWVAVDHYRLDAPWETQLRSVSRRVLCVEDLAGRRHDCDLFLDQNLPDAMTDAQPRLLPEHCGRLLGPRFALLRREFVDSRRQLPPRSGPVRRVLVSFGGSDAQDYTSMALAALRKLNWAGLEVDVVLGSAHPNRAHIASQCEGHWNLHVQTQHMAQLMAKADLAMTAAGSSIWECCCLGLPSLATAIADNQVRLVREGARIGILCAVEAAGLTAESLAGKLQSAIDNQGLRESLSRAGMALVDGAGAGRVARAMGFFLVTMRRASAADAADLFAWRNHPAIRLASHSTQPLVWAEHVRWLEEVLVDHSRVLLIAEAAGRPAGVVRFDMRDESAQVSIYAVPDRDPEIRGGEVLAAAEVWLIRNRPRLKEFLATVREDNVASQRMFASAGFKRETSGYRKEVN